MKIDWNQKYTTIAVYTVLTALAILLIIAAIMYFPALLTLLGVLNRILTPVWLGLIFAYLMNPILRLCEKRVFRFKVTAKRQKNLKRALSLVLTLIIVFILITVLILLIFPQVYLSFLDLTSKLGGYIQSTAALIDEFTSSIDSFLESSVFSDLLGSDINTVNDLFSKLFDFDRVAEQLQKLITSIPQLVKDYFPQVMDYFTGIANGFINVLLGFFFSIYFLASKEKLIAQLKKLLRSVSSLKTYSTILELCSFTDKTFGGFITGKLLDSVIIGILCFIICAICRMPYALLLSVIIGITNVIPVVGPFIGAVPGFFIIFIIDPIKAFWFAVINVILQQLDGNVIGPKILGQTTGLSAVWVLFSITFMGSLWGLIGMLVAVPVFAVLYSLLKLGVEKLLAKRGLPTATAEYYPAPDQSLPDIKEPSFPARLKSFIAKFIKKKK